MKKIISSLLILVGLSAFAQDKTAPKTPVKQPVQRESSSSLKTSSSVSAPLPYDVNDKYMGRKLEFLNQMTVTELPADFPLYEKQWGVKEYNAVVDAYYKNHLSILKPNVQSKMKYQMQ